MSSATNCNFHNQIFDGLQVVLEVSLPCHLNNEKQSSVHTFDYAKFEQLCKDKPGLIQAMINNRVMKWKIVKDNRTYFVANKGVEYNPHAMFKYLKQFIRDDIQQQLNNQDEVMMDAM
jgi:hypothetical protein